MNNIQILKKLFIKVYRMKQKSIDFMNDLVHNPKKNRQTETPNKYIHIGYPKSASTAIQKGFFGIHNQLHHLGCGAKKKSNFWDDHGYINEELNIAMEIDLRYKTNFSYDKDRIKEIFEKQFNEAKNNKNIHAVGISNENFCFNWHGGIDVTEKAKRLKYIFGENTQILVVLRNQKALIESLYKETIRFGYPGSFHEYLKYLWIYKDRNFLYEFCFDKIIHLYSELFNSNNVHILFFEDLKKNPKNFLQNISTAIGVDYYKLDLSKEYNKQLNNKELYIKREINKKYPHTFGKGKYSIVDNHRYIPYYTSELKDKIDDDVYIDYYTRQHFNQLSKSLNDKIESPNIDLDWNNKYGENILNLFSEANGVLSKSNPIIRRELKEFNYLNLK